MNSGGAGCCGQPLLSPDEVTTLAGKGEHGFPSWYQAWGPDTNCGSSRVLHHLLCGSGRQVPTSIGTAGSDEDRGLEPRSPCLRNSGAEQCVWFLHCQTVVSLPTQRACYAPHWRDNSLCLMISVVGAMQSLARQHWSVVRAGL